MNEAVDGDSDKGWMSYLTCRTIAGVGLPQRNSSECSYAMYPYKFRRQK
jgi:hypothetical protein